MYFCYNNYNIQTKIEIKLSAITIFFTQVSHGGKGTFI